MAPEQSEPLDTIEPDVEQPALDAPALAPVLDALREQRDRAGVTLEAISANTKIPVRILEAIESGDLAQLPAGIYARSYVKAYAAAIGADPDEVLALVLPALPDAEPFTIAHVEPRVSTTAPEDPSLEAGSMPPMPAVTPLGTQLKSAALMILVAFAGVGVIATSRMVYEPAPSTGISASAESAGGVAEPYRVYQAPPRVVASTAPARASAPVPAPAPPETPATSAWPAPPVVSENAVESAAVGTTGQLEPAGPPTSRTVTRSRTRDTQRERAGSNPLRPVGTAFTKVGKGFKKFFGGGDDKPTRRERESRQRSNARR